MTSHANLTRQDGATIAYHRLAGSGPAVMFLGGLRSDMTGAKALYLEDYCRRRGQSYLRFDYFGHGASSGDAELGTIGRWVQDAIAVLDSLTEGPQLLVGSSMGGWIMLLAALARPSRVGGVVGIAAAPDFTEDLVWSRLAPAQQHELREFGAITLRSEYDPAGYTFRLGLFDEGKLHLLMRGAIAVDCPVRLLHGMSDASVPWQTSLSLVERLTSRDVQVTLIKDGDHRLSRNGDLERLGRTLDELFETVC